MAKKSLLKLSVSTEDIDVTINDNAPLDETPAESDANDAEAVQEVASASDEVEEVLSMSKELMEVVDNFVFIRNYIDNRGITRELLAITNVNGELSQALGLPLPHFEEDSLPTDITDDQLAEVPKDVALEAIGEKIMGFLGKIKNIVTSVGGKISNLVSKYGTLAGRLNNKIAKVTDKVHGNIDEEATATKAIKAYTAAEFKTFVTKLNQALGQTFEVKGTESQLKWAADILGMVGYKYTAEKNTALYLGEKVGDFYEHDLVKSKEGVVTANKSTLGELGWNASFLKGMLEPTKQLIGKISDLKKFEKAFSEESIKKSDNIFAQLDNRDITTKEKAIATNRMNAIESIVYTYGRAFSEVAKATVEVINMYAMAAGKIVTKAE